MAAFTADVLLQCWQRLTYTNTHSISLSHRRAHSASVHLQLSKGDHDPVSRLGWLPWQSFPLNIMVYPPSPAWTEIIPAVYVCVYAWCACMFFFKGSLSCTWNGVFCLLFRKSRPKPQICPLSSHGLIQFLLRTAGFCRNSHLFHSLAF